MLYPYPPRCSALYQKLRNQPDTVEGAITDRSNTQWQCDLSINRTDVQPVGFSRDMGIGKMFSDAVRSPDRTNFAGRSGSPAGEFAPSEKPIR